MGLHTGLCGGEYDARGGGVTGEDSGERLSRGFIYIVANFKEYRQGGTECSLITQRFVGRGCEARGWTHGDQARALIAKSSLLQRQKDNSAQVSPVTGGITQERQLDWEGGRLRTRHEAIWEELQRTAPNAGSAPHSASWTYSIAPAILDALRIRGENPLVSRFGPASPIEGQADKRRLE